MMKTALVSVLTFAMAGVLAAQTQSPGAQAPAVDLKVGDKAPDFSLPGTDGKTHTLADGKGKITVLAWYPKAFTGGCTAECKSITANSEALKAFDVDYFMASVDDPDTNKKFAEQEQANFPMLSDPSRQVAAAYGVVPNTTSGVAKRWTFYIGGDGKILFIDKNVNPNVSTAGTDLAAKLTELGAKKK
jgi:thioredoxin-dependent peroxiredoxin